MPLGGQTWTTLDVLAVSHFNGFRRHEPGLFGIGAQPHFAIGQWALLLCTPQGNSLPSRSERRLRGSSGRATFGTVSGQFGSGARPGGVEVAPSALPEVTNAAALQARERERADSHDVAEDEGPSRSRL